MPVWGGSVAGFRPILPIPGPGDVVAGASAFWGLRAYSLATAGNKAVRLRRGGAGGDNVEQDFNTLSTGDLDTGAIATFLAAAPNPPTATLFFVKLYEQSGGGGPDMQQTTAANQPTFTLSGLGILPIMTFVSANSQRLVSAVNRARPTQPATSIAVANHSTTAAKGSVYVINPTTPSFQLGYRTNADNQLSIYAGTNFNVTASDNAWHAVAGMFNGASSIASVDGTQTTGNANTLTSTAAAEEIGDWNNTQYVDASVTEIITYEFGLSPGQLSSMAINQRAYWGF